MPERVTAIVVNWNAGENLAQCIAALFNQKKIDLDVVVVDNASSDNSLGALETYGDRVRIVQTGKNLGFGRAVNRGVAVSQSAIVVALNPDVVLQPDAVNAMVDFLNTNAPVGMVGPKLKNAEGQVIASCGEAPKLRDEICRKFLLHLIFPLLKFRRQKPSKPKAVAWVTGACFAVRRRVLDAIKGLDEAIFMYYEDVDLGLCINQAGWQVVYLPHAEGIHIGVESSKQALTRMLVVSEASYAYFIAKHLGQWAACLLRLLRPIEMTLRALLWGSVFLLAHRRRTEARARLRAYWFILTHGAVEEGP
jgi:GT2 family glycosyltransferase